MGGGKYVRENKVLQVPDVSSWSMCSDSSGTWTGSGKTWTSRLRHKCSSSVTFFLCTWTLFPALPPSLARSLTHSLAVPRGIVKSLSRP